MVGSKAVIKVVKISFGAIQEDAVHEIRATVLVSPVESEPSRHYQATYQQCFQEEQLKSQGLPEAHCYGKA